VEAPTPQDKGAAAPGRKQSAARRKSEPAAVCNAKAGAFAVKAFLMTGYEDARERRRITKLINDHGGSVVDSIPLPEVLLRLGNPDLITPLSGQAVGCLECADSIPLPEMLQRVGHPILITLNQAKRLMY
jgi:hypothetical protein